MTLANQQAFPSFVTTKCEDGTDDFEPRPGMTLRQYYAGLAMQGIVSTRAHGIQSDDVAPLMADAVLLADSLLAELERKA